MLLSKLVPRRGDDRRRARRSAHHPLRVPRRRCSRGCSPAWRPHCNPAARISWRRSSRARARERVIDRARAARCSSRRARCPSSFSWAPDCSCAACRTSLRFGSATMWIRCCTYRPKCAVLHLDKEQEIALKARLEEAARTAPGVERATAGADRSAPADANVTSFSVPGIDSAAHLGQFLMQMGSVDFFRTMGTRIVRGRGFDSTDRRESPRSHRRVGRHGAEALARARTRSGKCVKVGGDTMPCATVIGVAENIKASDITSDDALQYYLSIEQQRPAGAALFIRTRGARGSASGAHSKAPAAADAGTLVRHCHANAQHRRRCPRVPGAWAPPCSSSSAFSRSFSPPSACTA